MKYFASGLFLIAQMMPAGPPAQLTLVEYAITQGGLLGFSLVLLYFYRRDNHRIQANDAQRLSVMTDLVSSTNVALTKVSDTVVTQASMTNLALTKVADAVQMQSEGIRHLTHTVEVIEQRKFPR